jgi:hypothetical protein
VPFNVDPFQHCMVFSQFAVGEDGLPIWRAASNVFNKLLRTADKRWSPAMGWAGANRSSQ